MRISPSSPNRSSSTTSDVPSSQVNKSTEPKVKHPARDPFGGSGAGQAQGGRTQGRGHTQAHHSEKSGKSHHTQPDAVAVNRSSGAVQNLPEDPALGPNASSLPDPRARAREQATAWLEKQGIALDPDRIHYTYGHDSFGPRNQVGPSMTDIMLDNRQDLKSIDNGDWANLIGKSPKDIPRAIYGQLSYVPEGAYYDEHQQPIDPKQANGKVLYDADGKEVAPQKIDADIDAYTQYVYQTDLYKDVRTQLNDYFDKHGTELEAAHRGAYLQTVDQQAGLGSLSAAGAAMARQAASLAGNKTADALTPKDLQGHHQPQGEMTVAPLRIRDSESDSALVMTHDVTGRKVLYLPGTAFPFHEFDSGRAMDQWLATRSRDPQQREALARYFPYREQQAKGSDALNLSDHLAKLGQEAAAGGAPPVTSPANPIRSDIFQYGMDQLRRRVVDDESREVVSDATVHRQQVKQNLEDTLTFFDKLFMAYAKKYDRGLDV